MQTLIVVDVEADGPVQGDHSMVCFGAVTVKDLKTFYGQTAPISKLYIPSALAVSGISREQHESFRRPKEVMLEFEQWINEQSPKSKPTLVSDNNGFDAAWINWYFHKYLGRNPFGWSSRRIGDLFCGYNKDLYYKWKKHRVGKHTHHPVDDAMGNATALQYLLKQGFRI